MEDKYYLFDILASMKALVVNQATMLNEASNDELHKKYITMFKETSDMQKDLFDYAYENKWYVLEEAEATKIDKECKKLCDELNSI